MDKTFLLEQLSARLRATVQHTLRAALEAGEEARTGANRAVNLARGQSLRTAAAKDALEALESFRVKPLRKGEAIGLGAVVELEDGTAGRTLFLAPAGAGEELTGPDGDGIFQVVTPVSPFGKAMLGKRVGDVVEVAVAGDTQEWTIVYAA
jgi:transcription elongation GreA/GreB family factor